jgi:hypothetical protein
MKFKFEAENGETVETEAKSELAARRKIRRIGRELTLKNVIHEKYGKLKLIKEPKNENSNNAPSTRSIY